MIPKKEVVVSIKESLAQFQRLFRCEEWQSWIAAFTFETQ